MRSMQQHLGRLPLGRSRDPQVSRVVHVALVVSLTVAGATATPALAAEGGGAQALLTPHIGTVFWTLLTFCIMAFVLRRYAWAPLLSALDAREQSIRDSIDKARKDRDEASGLLAQHKELVAEAHRQRSAAMEQGRREAETIKADLLSEANRQREQLLQQTEAQVEAGLKQAHSEFRGVAVDLAIEAAQKLIGKNLDGPTQRKLVEDHLADLEKLGGSSSWAPGQN